MKSIEFVPPVEIDLKELKAFVLRAQQQYARGGGLLAKTSDGRKILTTENNRWKLTDEFDGGNPFCGIVRVIDRRGKHVVWSGYYHGWLTDVAARTERSPEKIFNFLRSALLKPDEHTLLRGPQAFAASDLHYTNILEFGTFARFFGHETIYRHNQLLYYGRYGGGLVDLTEDTGEA